MGKLFLLCALLAPLSLFFAGLCYLVDGPRILSGTLVCFSGIVDLSAYGVALFQRGAANEFCEAVAKPLAPESQ